MLVFEERGKPENPEKNLSKQRREPTTNSTHIWRQLRDLNLDRIGGRWVLSLYCTKAPPLPSHPPPPPHPNAVPAQYKNRQEASGLFQYKVVS